MSIKYYDFDTDAMSQDINDIFPGWEPGKENVAILSPHDDDAIIGAGYLIKAVQENKGNAYIVIFCNGDGGYSKIEQKDTIVDIRQKETVKAYQKIGVSEDKIVRFDYNDFAAIRSIAWEPEYGDKSVSKKMITTLRDLKITRTVIPNGYREHMDHCAAYISGLYDTPQAGDPILVDWAPPHAIKSTLQYSVWADFSPEDMLVSGRKGSIRANRAVIASSDVEDNIRDGIKEYVSQGEIIKGLIAGRQERRINKGFIELYISLEPRPKLDYSPYVDLLNKV
ncbi:MAG: PIG-L family deacetylase [Clostridia bacterium]|nr:PIG-L family deacetylase [Clostridia bacterium]